MHRYQRVQTVQNRVIARYEKGGFHDQRGGDAYKKASKSSEKKEKGELQKSVFGSKKGSDRL